ncbi:MAG: M14 family zinc carboxypeptidase [Bacteriovorax sp.]|nr:M14 family zinc carboxypeptidase [Bacteriovorax sp.]
MKSRHSKIVFLSLVLVILFSNSLSFAETPQLTPALSSFCKKMDIQFKKYGWDRSECEKYEWIHVRNSVVGDPLTWTVFGDTSDEEKPSFKQKDVSIIMCGVHGDEITPIKFCFDIMSYLKTVYADPEIFKKDFSNKIVIVAPLVNPDAFFKVRPSRVNAHGVDVNRNFPTKDWARDARRLWISNLRKDKRRNPGLKSNSEPEVVFQMNLIKRYAPDKIISVHSPLTMLDYDGPNTVVTGLVDGNRAHELLIQMSKDASDYKIENYPFFPGSLGNWAGKERDIPTYTLELPTSDPARSGQYWKLFKSAIHNAVAHDLKEKSNVKSAEKGDEKSEVKTDGIPVGTTAKIEDQKSAEVKPAKTELVD